MIDIKESFLKGCGFLRDIKMVSGRLKSKKSYRKVKVVAPGNTVKEQFKKKKPSKAKCGKCGGVLSGVPRERPYKMQNMPKTMKRPERPYGGVLCSRCMRAKLKEKVHI